MEYQTIRLAVEDGIAVLTLARPEKMNALNTQMRAEILHAVRAAGTEARVLVITGEGRAFCAGQDLGDRATALERCVHFHRADVEHLAFPDGSFDTAVTSLLLCSVVDQRRALAEIRRVLRQPGGRLLLLEHMRPHAHPWTWLADALNVPWYAFNGRCHLNRETQQAVVHAGFEVKQVESRAGGLFRLIVAHTT